MSWRSEIESIAGARAHWDADLSTCTTFRLVSRGDLVDVATEDGLAEVLRALTRAGRSYRALGWGANQVLTPSEKDVLVRLDFPLEPSVLATSRDEYVLPASVGLNVLTAHAMKHGHMGWEALTGIPASLGGAIAMNAGTALGEIGAIIRRVRLMEPSGSVRTEEISPASFVYRGNRFIRRGEIVVGATLYHHGYSPEVPDKIRRYLDYRKQTQPLASKNCGCVFKNASPTLPAGRLIDLAGLKGLQEGPLKVSSRHANFMENTGGADSEDFRKLVERINRQTLLHWGVVFELEVKAL